MAHAVTKRRKPSLEHHQPIKGQPHYRLFWIDHLGVTSEGFTDQDLAQLAYANLAGRLDSTTAQLVYYPMNDGPTETIMSF